MLSEVRLLTLLCCDTVVEEAVDDCVWRGRVESLASPTQPTAQLAASDVL